MFPSKKTQYHQAKILIVDDRPDNLELLSTICILQGFEAISANSGAMAIELAKKQCPHVILLDISMPEMDGFTVCQILKQDELTKDIPVIFISVLNEVKNKAQAFELGGNDYITKPFQVEDVVARVENQLKFYYVQTELKEKNQQLAQEIQERQSAEIRLIELNQRLSKLATSDSLTNIANRRYFNEILAKEWRRGKKEGSPLSFILCDIDYFKLYNDRFGHQAGDLCLKKIAEAILETANRSGDLVSRYGGEEFAVILPQTSSEDAMAMAEKIRQRVKKLDISHPDSLVGDRISLSLGVTSMVPSPEYNEQQLLLTADKALYEAKERGRDCYVFQSI